MNRWLVATLVFSFLMSVARAEDYRVTVVAVLASDRHKTIDPKLAQLAEEVRKRDQTLTGFKIERTTVETIPLGQKKSFPLVADVSADVTVVSYDPKERKIKVTAKAPHAGEITYTTVPDKFFPILTRYQTEKDKDHLIYALAIKPVPSKDKADEFKSKSFE
ncbi:MAG: hypothetical protein K1X57_19630 [Gemmataceae bacterium]|nr:hypothetical protein [Gemmataceae bacterium]